MRDLQEVFNIVWERAKNPVRAESSGMFGIVDCAYRDENGLPCFLGACISDEDYDPDMEGTGASGLEENFEEEFIKSFGDTRSNHLTDLQMIHDYASPDNWKEHLTMFAEDNKLTIPE